MRGLWQVVLLSPAVLAASNAVAQAADHPLRPLLHPPALLAKNIGGQVILRVQRDAQGRPRMSWSNAAPAIRNTTNSTCALPGSQSGCPDGLRGQGGAA